MNDLLINILNALYYFFQYTIVLYTLFVALIYALTIYLGVRAIIPYYTRLTRRSLESILQRDLYIPISILVPAYNEEQSIVASVRSFLTLHYPQFEVLVMVDGATDQTLNRLIEAYELYESAYPYHESVQTQPIKRLFRSTRYPNLIVGEKANGGKGDAMNAGLNLAKYPIVCAVDADSLLDVEALLRAARLFLEDEEIVGVGATIRPLNGATIENGKIIELNLPDNWLARMQILEYSRAFVSGRSGWARMNALMIISGAFGLFRREMMLTLDGWSSETITEDIELMIKIHRYHRDRNLPYRIDFIPEPLCWTEVPEDLTSLRKQRNRWHRGLFEVLWMHRDMAFNPRYGIIGMLAIPYYWLVEGLSPVIEMLGYIFILVAVYLGIIAVDVALSLAVFALLYGVMISQIAMGVESLLVYRYNKLSARLILTALSVLEFIGYRQILLFERFVATFQVQSKQGQWGKMRRTGFS
ncbi:MAG: glycosyltransferase family 2 protein [Anaerolineae bacterium]